LEGRQNLQTAERSEPCCIANDYSVFMCQRINSECRMNNYAQFKPLETVLPNT